MWLERWVDVFAARIGEDDPATRGAKARAFLWILAIHQVAEFWYFPIRFWDRIFEVGDWQQLAIPIAGTLCAALTVLPRTRAWGFAGMFAAQMGFVASHFPGTANHSYLEAMLLAFGAWLDPDDEAQQPLLLAAARWMAVLILFFAGFQKLWHGHWFQGEQLAYLVRAKGFAGFLGLFASPEEMQRLLSYRLEPGQGPFRFESPFVIALSNAAWMTEIGGAIGLLMRRTRLLALGGLVAFLLITEMMARELFFLGLYLNLLLLWLGPDWNRRLLPGFVVFYLWLTGMALGWVPGFFFT